MTRLFCDFVGICVLTRTGDNATVDHPQRLTARGRRVGTAVLKLSSCPLRSEALDVGRVSFEVPGAWRMPTSSKDLSQVWIGCDKSPHCINRVFYNNHRGASTMLIVPSNLIDSGFID